MVSTFEYFRCNRNYPRLVGQEKLSAHASQYHVGTYRYYRFREVVSVIILALSQASHESM